MKWGFAVIFLSLFLSFTVNLTNATTWYVHPDSSLNSIQEALDSCSNDDTVLVAPGIYNENIVWHNNIQGIHLKSECGPSITIIDGSGSSVLPVVCITILADTTTIIDGFCIRNGSSSFGGGGIYSESGSPTIINNIITSNTASIYGGGVYCSVGSPIIVRNTITGNSSENGGGIYCAGGTPIIKFNSIAGNSAVSGAGIYCISSSPNIDSCIVSNNTGNGIYCCYSSNPTINFCNIIDNFTYGILNKDSTVIINAEYNWWGDPTGPFHPDSNPGGQGDTVSNWVDFIPWLTGPIGIKEEGQDQRHKATDLRLICHPNPFTTSTTIHFSSIERRAEGIELTVYDASGRLVKSIPLSTNNLSLGTDLSPGIYFLKTDGKYVGKVVKVR